MLDAVVFAHGGSFADAVAFAKSWLGWPAADGSLPSRDVAKHILKPRPPVVDLDDADKRKQAQVRAMWAQAQPIAGTLGEVYLNSRAIAPDVWPDAVRWHDRMRAVLLAKHLPDGSAVTQLQAIHLDAAGNVVLIPGKDGKPPRKKKLTRGPGLHGAVRLPGDTRALCLAEGPETALSIWHAAGIETWCALGQVKTVSLEHVPKSRPIVVCRDDDARNAQSRKAVRDAIRKWRREGRQVVEALPWKLTRRDKSDFNDALQDIGRDAVRERIEAALPNPHAEAEQAMPVQWARKQLADTMAAAIGDLWDHRDQAQAKALKVGVGIGKTETALRLAKGWIEAGRGVVIYAVPEHRLGSGIIERARALLGTENVAMWRGREQADHDTDEPLCRNLEAVELMQSAGGNVERQVCRSGKNTCPHYETCGYQAQREQKADFWIVSHASLFNEKPAGVPRPSLVIVDEDFWQAGLTAGSTVTQADIDGETHLLDINIAGLKDTKHARMLPELAPYREKLARLLDAAPAGRLEYRDVIEAGIAQDDCNAAHGLEWERWQPPYGKPGDNLETLKSKLASSVDCSDVPRLGGLWRELGLFLHAGSIHDRCGRITVTDDGFSVTRRKDIEIKWRAPTLVMSATLRLDLVRPYFPSVEMVAGIQAAAPHQRVIYHHGKSFSHAVLNGTQAEQKAGTLPKSAENLRKAIWEHALALHRLNGGETLLIAPLAVEEWLREQFDVPDGLHLAHHGAIAGRDEWRDVRTMVQVGRTQPPPDAVAGMASKISGLAVESLQDEDGWYPARLVTLTDRRGQSVTVEAETAGDGLAETVRASICEDAALQGTGRARGVNRSEADPVEIHLFGTGPIPGVEIDELREWKRLSKEEIFTAETGVWLESAGDMAGLMGIDRNTLKVARQRLNQMGTLSYNNSLYETVPIWLDAKYRRKIERHGWQTVRYDPRLIPDVEAYLTEQLGLIEVELPEPVEAKAMSEPVEPCRSYREHHREHVRPDGSVVRIVERPAELIHVAAAKEITATGWIRCRPGRRTFTLAEIAPT